MKAVVFDFDGLLVDTEAAIFSIWREIYRSHKAVLTSEQWIKCVGTFGGFDPYAHLEDLRGQSIDRAAVRAIYETRRDLETSKLDLLSGVAEKLSEAKSLGLKVGLASGSTKAWVSGHLQRLKVLDQFEHVCTRDDVKNVKPSPDLYLLAAARLECEPQECLAFEDSANGLLSAKAAGMRCVIVPNKVTAQSDFSTADLVIPSLSHLSLKKLLEHFSMV